MARRKTDKKKDFSKITEAEFIKLMEKAEKWFQPKIVKDSDGNVYDAHESNLFIGEFLLSEGIGRFQLDNLFRTKPYFRDKYYSKISQVQEYKLAKMGLFRQLDSSLVKYTLSNKHGWTDKTENKNTHEVKEVDLTKLIGFKKPNNNESDD